MDSPSMMPQQDDENSPAQEAGAQAGDAGARAMEGGRSHAAQGAESGQRAEHEDGRGPLAPAVPPADDLGAVPGAEVFERRAALPVAGEAPDSLTEMMQPAAPATGRTEEGPRISTVLGPLPERATVQQTRDLNDAVHQILVVGLIVSTALLLTGAVLAIVSGAGFPTSMLSLPDALAGALQLEPAALLSLGLIALMFTPIVRVIGSVVVFVWERDWLYAAVTLTVLVVMGISVVVGHG